MVIPDRDYTFQNYRFGYQGQFAEKDDETGYSQFEARLYDSRICRWMVPDPAGQYWSPYLAMGNNPINSTDPDGEFVFRAAGAIIGGLVGAGASIITQSIAGESINWKSVAVSAGQGALIGALPELGLTSALGMGLAAAGVGAASEIIDQKWAQGAENINWGKVALNGGISGVTAGISMGASNSMHNSARSFIRPGMGQVMTKYSRGFVGRLFYYNPGAASVILGSSVDITTAATKGIIQAIINRKASSPGSYPVTLQELIQYSDKQTFDFSLPLEIEEVIVTPH